VAPRRISVANFKLGTTPSGYGYSLAASSGTLSLTGDVAPPPAPTGLDCRNQFLHGEPELDGIRRSRQYNVETFAHQAAAVTRPPQPGVTATTCADGGLVDGVTYYYVVSAVKRAGEGVNSRRSTARPSPLVTTIEKLGTTVSVSRSTGSLAFKSSSWATLIRFNTRIIL